MDDGATMAWATGLFEGEGCIYVSGRKVRLTLVMSDRDVVERFQQAVGCGSVRLRKPQKDHWSEMHAFQVGDAEQVLGVLTKMLPLLGSRRRGKAEEAMRVAEETVRRKAVEFAHGTHSRYIQGCRCDDCRASNTRRCQEYRQRRRQTAA